MAVQVYGPVSSALLKLLHLIYRLLDEVNGNSVRVYTSHTGLMHIALSSPHLLVPFLHLGLVRL